ncbi:MAG: PD-(D/E)XK nuclease family protein [Elusimicrobia bacterium]|nr:PD-(D/E)XK nuclease family protein [Elusimicrobiota bacterium]
MKPIFLDYGENLPEIAAREISSCANPQNALLVFPNKRPGYFAAKYLSEKKGPIISPKIFSQDEFIDELFSNLKDKTIKVKRFYDPDLAAVLMFDLKKEFHSFLNKKEGEAENPFLLAWAMRMISAFEECKIASVEPKRLRKFDFLSSPDKSADSLNKKFERFSDLYEKFYFLCADKGFYTRAMKYSCLAERSKDCAEYCLSFEKAVFGGFFVLNKSEKIILQEIAENGNSLFIYGDSPLLEGKSVHDRPKKELKREKPKIKFVKCLSRQHEVFELKKELGCSDGASKKSFGQDNAVIIPESSYLPPALEIVFPNISEFNISAGYSLKMTPIYGLFLALENLFGSLNAQKEFSARSYFSFAFHPYIKNFKANKGKENAEKTRMAFQNLRDYAAKEKISFISLKELSDLGGSEVKEINESLIAPFLNSSSLGEFCEAAEDFIDSISFYSTGNLHPYWNYFPSIMKEKAQEIKNSLLSKVSFKNTKEYVSFFNSYCSASAYPFSGSPVRGLQGLGFLESRNLKFEKIYFLGFCENIFPSVKKEDEILPYEARLELGLSTYKEKSEIYSYYFERLIYSSKEAVFFYTQDDESGLSPFGEKLKWDYEKEKIKYEERFSLSPVSFAPYKIKPVKKTDKMKDFLKSQIYSYSSLDAYLSCGLKFYYSKVLRLGEEDELMSEREPKEIGEALHKILEKFFFMKGFESPYKEKIIIMEKALKEVSDKILKDKETNGISYMEYFQIRKRCFDFLNFHEKDRSKFKILEGEKEIHFEINVKGHVFKLKSRLDRIDDRDGEIVVCDYKTGGLDFKKYIPKASVEKDGLPEIFQGNKNKIGSLQLPVYCMAAETIYKSKEINASIITLGLPQIKEDLLFKKEDNRPAKLKIYKEAVSLALDEIVGCDSFNPAEDEKECEYCPFARFCNIYNS